MELTTEIQFIKGVGPKLAAKLQNLNIHTVKDFLYAFPRSYEDRRKGLKASDFVNNVKEDVYLIATLLDYQDQGYKMSVI